jgi:transposase
MLGFKTFRCARILLAGIEIMHMIAKGQVKCAREPIRPPLINSTNWQHKQYLSFGILFSAPLTATKPAIVRETFEPGATVSGVARRHQVNANQVFAWRKLYQDGSLSAVSAGEQVVPASDLAEAMKQIRELQRLLGKNGMDASSSHNEAPSYRENANGTDSRGRGYCQARLSAALDRYRYRRRVRPAASSQRISGTLR